MAKSNPKFCRRDPTNWPKSIRLAVETISALFAYGFQAARERAWNLGGMTHAVAEDCAKDKLIRQQATELDLWRRRFKAMRPKERPHFTPQDRLMILRLAFSNGWSIKEIAQRFVVSVSTASRWFNIWHGEAEPGLFFGQPPWNKISDVVRALIHECRMHFPESEIGTRTIAAQIQKALVAVSRTTVQRVLKERPPRKSSVSKASPKHRDKNEVEPHHILKPEMTNRTWHLDMTVIRILWLRIHVTAILDGFSRKLLVLSPSIETPTTVSVMRILKKTVRQHGKPKFLVFDNGGQFQKHFLGAVKRLRIIPIQSRPRHPEFNGKIERLFRTMKQWQRLTMMLVGIKCVQKQLDQFRGWYNNERCHQALALRTPDEAWNGTVRPKPTRFLSNSTRQPEIRVRRTNHCGDPNLPVFSIHVMKNAA